MLKNKILLLDIETMANLAWVWGKYEQNVIAYEQEGFMLSVSYKWLGEKKVHFKSLKDFKGHKAKSTNDKELTKFIHGLFQEADMIVAHNGNAFDTKYIQGRFLKWNLLPPSDTKFIDTKLIAKRYFKFNSNSLDDLGEFLGLGRKVKHEGWDMWMGCYNNESKYWKMMKKYNDQDVVLLEKVYLRMRPYHTQHPRINLHTPNNPNCPKCNSSRVQKRGFRISGLGTIKQQYQCQSCGGWWAGETIKNKK